MYGYVPGITGISIERLGAKPGDEYVDGIDVIWMSRPPKSTDTVVVGCYRNARVYRSPQSLPVGANRAVEGTAITFLASARRSDCRLFSPIERVCQIPSSKQVKGGFGMSPIWYGTDLPKVLEDVRRLVTRGLVPPPPKQSRQGRRPRNQDPELRIKIEKFAVDRATKHFESLQYDVISTEKDRCGWDLSVSAGSMSFQVEVKGVSGRLAYAELTPNEYSVSTSDEYKRTYVIYIVTGCLTEKARDHIFQYYEGQNGWFDSDNRELSIEPIVGASLRALG